MAAINSNTFLDGGVARTAGEAMTIGVGARFTVRTDSRIHANAPASFLGSLGSPTFTGIGGEFFIDATAVREVSYTGGSGNAPSIGTAITQGGVSGYYLGCWAAIGTAPVAVGAAIPASGIIKFREVTGGAFAAGALTGIAATCAGADRPSWIEIAWDAAVNFVVPRVGSFKSRGNWYEIGETNGTVGQQLLVPTSSSVLTNVFAPGCWVETAPASGEYEFWTGLSSVATMWRRESLGFAEGYTDKRAKFCKTFGAGVIKFGESASLAATYASLAAQVGTYVGIAISGTYTWAGDVVTVNTGATAHLMDSGQQTGLDFTSGGGVDGIHTVTVLDAYNFTVPYVGSIAGGNVTVRPGVTVSFATHGLNQGESVYCNFTTGTGVDGTYPIYGVTGTGTYVISYPHLAALTGGAVSCLHTLVITATAHGHAIGNEVYCDFTSGGATSDRYVMKVVAANTLNVNFPHAAAIATSNVTLKWTIGHVPESGCKVRIPNILMAECATASRQTNSIPNATIASRPEFNTTSAGAVDLENIYALSMRSIFSQAYSVRVHDCAVMESLQVSECATALDVQNVGVGCYSAQDSRALQLTSNFAGGTIDTVWAHRPTIGTGDHSTEVSYCAGLTINNLETGIIGYARSSGKPINILGSQNITFNNPRVMNGNIDIATSVNIAINDLDYNDRIIGRTSATAPYYCLTVAAGCDRITLDGVTFGMGGTVEDCHPYTGILLNTGATNIKARNIGTPDAYLKTGVWAPNYAAMGIVLASGGNNNTIKLQKAFVGRLRTALTSTINSDKNCLYEQILSSSPWAHGAKAIFTSTLASLNTKTKGMTTGAILVTGQTSVYGTHWLDLYQGNKYGAIALVMNEPTAETSAYWSNPAGVAKFNSAGGIEMRAIGAEAIWEMPYFAQGHTGFANVTPVMSGGTIGNYTITYQIDTGSGWNGTWNTLNTTNLTGETISPVTGFKLKIRIVTGIVNTTAITFLRIITLTNTAAQNAVSFPLDSNTVTFAGLPTGCDAVVLTAGTTTILDQRDSLAGTTYSYTYSGAQTVDVGFIKPGYVPYYFRNLSLGTTDSSLPVTLTIDRNYY